MVKKISPKFSFNGWDVWEFVKGRKKTAVTIVATALGYFISNNEAVALASGAIVEGLWAVIEYYSKHINL